MIKIDVNLHDLETLKTIHQIAHEALAHFYCYSKNYVDDFECCAKLAALSLTVKNILDNIGKRNTLIVYTKQSLIEHNKQKNSLEYLFFWKQTKNVIDYGCFSQWYLCSFILNGITYKSAEQYMMAEKARLFEDNKQLEKILKSESAREIKMLGREIKNFDEERWAANRLEIVVQGNKAKFLQNLPLKKLLLETGSKVLVEASPVDAVWGIGLPAEDPRALDPQAWPGLNLLGFALMIVRNQIAHYDSL